MSTATRGSAPAAKPKSPFVICASSSLDGTSFAVAMESVERLRETFPKVCVTTRVFISHNPREGFHRFEDQIAFMLTGISRSALVKMLGPILFRDPRSTQEPMAQRRRA